MSYRVDKSLPKYIPSEGPILDAGCGYFRFSNYLKKYDKKAICIDIFIPDIDEAKRNDFLLASVENLPFKDNSFDFIYCWSVIQFIKDDTRTVNEFHRILKPGGNLLISVPTSRSVFRLLRELEILCGVYRWPKFNVKHHHYYTRGDIRKLVYEKFIVTDIRGYRYNFVPRLCGFLISISRFMTIFRLLRLYALLNRIKRRINKRNVSNNTTHKNLDEETNVNVQINGTFSRLWDRFEFISDLSFHYIVTLKKQEYGKISG